MSTKRCYVFVALALLAGEAGSARAECGRPNWIGTPAGMSLPPRGVLYHFDSYPDEWTEKEPYDAAGASELVRIDPWDTEWRWPIDPDWKAPTEAPRVLLIEQAERRGCPPSHVLAIQIDQPVAAVKVIWATAEKTQKMVIAPRPSQTPDGRPASILLLGRLDCYVHNVPVADLERGVLLGLTAIRFDGSEAPVRDVPTFVAMNDFPRVPYPTPLGFIDEAVAAAPASAPRRTPVQGGMAIALVLGAIVLGARRGLAGAAAGRLKLPTASMRRG